MKHSRRVFVISMAAAGAGVAGSAHAQARVDEKDAAAMALGYLADGTKTDTKKYPKYAVGQMCGACVLYQGKAPDASGGCPLFPGKHVAEKGWCSGWTKKA